ncbi:MerR family transcriptional regulator [Streptomyces murinus]|uniref:MerR family transcriptional regulator n=1 Tax=Streptomyces murinus TaxID=33900 RepID=UPI003822AEB0
MRISQLAERSGVPATTLRFYEGAGLLPAERTPSGYRVYDEEAVQRLAFINAAKHLGLPLEEIGELLAVWETAACRDVRADLRPRVVARIEDAERRSAEPAAFTAALHRGLEHLDTLPDRAGRCDPRCHFLIPASPPNITPASPPQAAQPGSVPGAGPDAVSQPCALTGQASRERIAAWREATDGAVRTIVPDGVRLTLPPTRAGGLAQLAAAEQQCCPSPDFRLHLDGSSVHLEVRAPALAAARIAELFSPAA